MGTATGFQGDGQGVGVGRARGGGQGGKRGHGAALPGERCRGRALAGRCRVRADRIQGSLRGPCRGRLVRCRRQRRPRRPGLAEDARRAPRGDALGRQRQPLSVRCVDGGRGGLHRHPRRRGDEAHLPAEALRRRVDRGDGVDGVPRRHGSRHDPHPCGGGRGWHLPGYRHQDLHHQRRARRRCEHRSPGTCEATGCPGGQPWHLAVPGAEISSRRNAQHLRQRVHRTQDGYPGQRHIGDQLRRRHRLPHRGSERRACQHVHDDELRPAIAGHSRTRSRRTCLSERRGLRPGATAGAGGFGTEESRRAGGLDPGTPRRATHAAHPAGLHRGRAGLRDLRGNDARPYQVCGG